MTERNRVGYGGFPPDPRWPGEVRVVVQFVLNINKFGGPIVSDNFRTDYWDRILASLKIRQRKFYAMRHTFITQCVEAGYSLKGIADYAGTSTNMKIVEKYGVPDGI